MTRSNLANALDWLSDWMQLLKHIFSEIRYQLRDIIGAMLGLPVPDDDGETTVAQRFACLGNCFHDWAGEGFFYLRGACRALMGYPPENHEPTPEKLERLKQSLKRSNEIYRHYEAARNGTGPQPFDRDWYAYNQDISDEIVQLAKRAGWHRLQDFIEVLQWAFKSPQAQRAMMLNQDRVGSDPTAPCHEPMELLNEIYDKLVEVSHDLLRAHAATLHYSEESTKNLTETLDKLLARSEEMRI